MIKVFRLLVLTVAVAAGAGVARAEVVQVIRVSVLSIDRARVERRVVTTAELSDAIAGHVRGHDAVAIRLYIPLGMDKAVIRQFMALCRKAGASNFTLVQKS